MCEIIPNREIYRSAQALIEKYGDRAWTEAMKHWERFWLTDNDNEMRLWRLIGAAILTIQIPDRDAGTTIQ